MHSRITGLIAGIAVGVFASLGLAQEHVHEGEQPPPRRLGAVHFPTSCGNAAQIEFDRAVALLHSFQFSRAIAGFQQVLADDPTCAVAYWGIALSAWSNPFAPGVKDAAQLQLGRESSERGRALRAGTEREQAYIAAVGELYEHVETTSQSVRLLGYRDAMAALARRYPADHEAQIFHALALAESEDPSDKTYASRLEAGAILEKMFDAEPTHPGLAHYIIHTYDVPTLAARALGAARRYAQIAPDAPHALHMPSHTFTRMGYWQESIDSNVAAAVAARREGQTAEELHAGDYEMYAYLQTGQDEAAARLLSSLPQLAARFNPDAMLNGAGGPAVGYFALAAMPARYALERRDWRQAAQLEERDTPFPYTEAMTWFARGVGAARAGRAAAANASAAALRSIAGRLRQTDEPYWSQQVHIQALGVAAWAAFAAGHGHTALRDMTAAAALEDATEKSAVTPGPLAPARELLGEMLLELKAPGRALTEFEATLSREPRRYRSLYGAAHAAQLIGKSDKSLRYFRQLLEVCANADAPGRFEIQEAMNAVAKQSD